MFFKKKDSSKELIKIQASADKLFSQRKYQKALNEYLKLTQSMPNDILLLNKIGDVYSKINDNINAFKYFERVADHHASTGFLPKAIAVYKKILKLDPEYTEARESLVKLYLQKQHTSEAKAELKKIADYYFENNLMSRALDTLKKLVELDPSNIQYHNQLAEILIKEGRSRDACQEFYEMASSFFEKKMLQQANMVIKKAQNIDPNHAGILIISAKIAIEQGKLDKAAQKLQKVLSDNPDNLEALKVMGNTLFKKEDYENAYQCYSQILQKDPSQTQLIEKVIDSLVQNRQLDQAVRYLKPLSELLLSQNKQEKAISLIRNILELEEAFEPAILLMTEIYLSTSMTPNAILTLEKAANHYLNIDRPSKAEHFIKKILEIDPDNLEWKSQLKSPNKPQQELEESVEEEPDMFLELPPTKENEEQNIDEISALISGEAEAAYLEDTSSSIKNQLTEVEILIRHGLMDQARVHLDKVLEKYPDHYEANLHLHQIYLEQNEPEKASDCGVALAKHFIENGQFDDALKYLDEAEPHRPAIVRKLRGDIQTQESIDASLKMEELSNNAYDPDFNASLSQKSQEDLIIQPPSEDEVVSVQPSSNGFNDFDTPDLHSSAPDDSIWALDIPAVGHEEIEVTDQTLEEEEIVFDFMKDALQPGSNQEKMGAGGPKSPNFEDQHEIDFLKDLSSGSDEDEGQIHIPLVDDDFSNEELSPLEKIEDQPVEEIVLEDHNEEQPIESDLIDFEEPAILTSDQEESASDELVDDAELALEDDFSDEKISPFEDLEDESSLEELTEKLDKELSFETPPDIISVPPDKTDELLVIEEVPEPEDLHEPVEDEPVILDEPPILETEPDGSGTEELADDADLVVVEEEDADSLKQEETLRGEIEEIDFFISMEAFDEAQNLVDEAIAKYGSLPELLDKQNEIPAASEKAPEPEHENIEPVLEGMPSKPESDLFDLASVLSEEFFDDEKDVTDNAAPEEFQSVEELFKEFKKGVAEQISDTDFQTHYDLGIGYKEMGLLQEGIAEFQIAQGDTSRYLDCATMISICQKEMGQTDEAVQTLEEALTHPNLTQEEIHLIKYELATTFEASGQLEKALEYFQNIVSESPDFRDASTRIKMLV